MEGKAAKKARFNDIKLAAELLGYSVSMFIEKNGENVFRDENTSDEEMVVGEDKVSLHFDGVSDYRCITYVLKAKDRSEKGWLYTLEEDSVTS